MDTFNALSDKAIRDYCPSLSLPELAQDSDSSMISQDIDEYWVDINEGMDLEESMAYAGILDNP